jgi:hypothetical protein
MTYSIKTVGEWNGCSYFLGKSVFFVPQVLQKCDIYPSCFISCKLTL